MKTHAEHETTVAIGRVQGFRLCLDCRVIVEDLPLCGVKTKRGGSCRWAVSVGSPTAEHPHTLTPQPERPQQSATVKRESKSRAFISTAEARWLRELVATRGHIEGQSVALSGIKRGQAELLTGRYGGVAEGTANDDWQWRCDGPQAASLLTLIQTD